MIYLYRNTRKAYLVEECLRSCLDGLDKSKIYRHKEKKLSHTSCLVSIFLYVKSFDSKPRYRVGYDRIMQIKCLEGSLLAPVSKLKE